MEKQKVFIPVDEQDEDMCGAFNSIDGRGGCYVKEQEGYFFTKEEFDYFLIKCRAHAGLTKTIKEYFKSLNIK